MQTYTEAHWMLLGRAIHERRLEVGYRSRARLAQDAGIDPSTLSDLEKARRTNFSPATLDAVCRALSWPGWAWRDILAGKRADDIETVAPQHVGQTNDPSVVERRLAAALDVLRTAQDDLGRGEHDSAAFSILAAIPILAATAEELGEGGDLARRVRNAITHTQTYQDAGQTRLPGMGSVRRDVDVRHLRDVDVRFDPTIHEPIAAHAPGEPTDAELREQHEAEEEAARAAEERRRQDENDDGA